MGSLGVEDDDPCLPLEISADISEAKSILFPSAALASGGNGRRSCSRFFVRLDAL